MHSSGAAHLDADIFQRVGEFPSAAHAVRRDFAGAAALEVQDDAVGAVIFGMDAGVENLLGTQAQVPLAALVEIHLFGIDAVAAATVYTPACERGNAGQGDDEHPVPRGTADRAKGGKTEAQNAHDDDEPITGAVLEHGGLGFQGMLGHDTNMTDLAERRIKPSSLHSEAGVKAQTELFASFPENGSVRKQGLMQKSGRCFIGTPNRVYTATMTFLTTALLCIAAALILSVAAVRVGVARRAEAGGTARDGVGDRSPVREAQPGRERRSAAGDRVFGRGAACEARSPRRERVSVTSNSSRADRRVSLGIHGGFHRILVHAAQGFGDNGVFQPKTEIFRQVRGVADQIRA